MNYRPHYASALRKLPNRFLAVIVATVALTLAGGGPAAFAQDRAAAGADADWERVGSGVSPDAETSNQVLEIPQACGDDSNVPCDGAPQIADDSHDSTVHESSTDDDGDDEDIEVARGGAPADSEVGAVVEEYQNEPVYVAVPYAMAMNPYRAATNRGPVNGNLRSLPPSAYTIAPMAMSSPLTPAALPPLSPGGSFMLRSR